MYGRYGADQLSRFTIWCYLAVAVVGIFVNEPWIGFALWLLGMILVFWTFFRMFSRNIYKRQAENAKYLKVQRKITEFFKYTWNKWKYRKTHVYKKCPHCKVKLKLPKKKGFHNVNCPKCRSSFDVKI
jgi:hypothetical protein